MTLEPSSFKDESDSLYSTAAVKDRVAWLQNKQDAFCWHVDFFLEDRIKSAARAGGSAGDVHKALLGYAALIAEVKSLTPDAFLQIQNAYSDEMRTFYASFLGSLFEQLQPRVQGSSILASKLSMLPDAAIGNHTDEMLTAKNKIAAALQGGDAMTYATGLRALLGELVPLIVEEQRVCTHLFRGISPAAIDGILERVFRMYTIVKRLEECFISNLDNNLEMLLMIVDVEAITTAHKDCNVFITAMTNPGNGLQIKLQLAVNAFIDEQIRWIQGFRENTRYCGVLSPVKKFASFIDRVVAIEEMVADKGQIVAIALQKIGMALIAWISDISEQRPKYVDICRIENLSFFVATVSARNVASLQNCLAGAEAALKRAKESYLEWIVQRPFGKLINFIQDARDLARTTNAADLSYHLSEADFQNALGELENAPKSMSNLLLRIKKHFARDGNLLTEVASWVLRYVLNVYDEAFVLAAEAFRTNVRVERRAIETAFKDCE